MRRSSDSSQTLILGAVAYDPKVLTIWEGFQRVFAARGLAFDFILFSNYERLVEALFDGTVDVAWNSPLAWIEADRLARARGRTASAVAMRDTDRDLTSVVLVRAPDPIASLSDLRGRIVAVGAADSPQATLIPLLALTEVGGLAPGRDFEVARHDVLPGKHGDHIGGEREAVKALLAGRVDAACVLDASLLAFGQEGTVAASATRILHQTPPYDHCNFTVLDGAPDELVDRFTTLLIGMRYDDPEVRPLMEQEGLTAWRPGRTSGYEQIARAADRLGAVDAWLARMGAPRMKPG